MSVLSSSYRCFKQATCTYIGKKVVCQQSTGIFTITFKICQCRFRADFNHAKKKTKKKRREGGQRIPINFVRGRQKRDVVDSGLKWQILIYRNRYNNEAVHCTWWLLHIPTWNVWAFPITSLESWPHVTDKRHFCSMTTRDCLPPQNDAATSF